MARLGHCWLYADQRLLRSFRDCSKLSGDGVALAVAHVGQGNFLTGAAGVDDLVELRPVLNALTVQRDDAILFLKPDLGGHRPGLNGAYLRLDLGRHALHGLQPGEKQQREKQVHAGTGEDDQSPLPSGLRVIGIRRGLPVLRLPLRLRIVGLASSLQPGRSPGSARLLKTRIPAIARNLVVAHTRYLGKATQKYYAKRIGGLADLFLYERRAEADGEFGDADAEGFGDEHVSHLVDEDQEYQAEDGYEYGQRLSPLLRSGRLPEALSRARRSASFTASMLFKLPAVAKLGT